MVAPLRRPLFLPLLVVLTGSGLVWGWAQQEKILLREIQALTLYPGRYTNYRRTSPVPQLHCTGGSAGCGAYTPEVVQCHNKGWDGYDVQWECKAHMDISYRFGKIEVSCEGYDYPDDPYILKGSCGLEYTLELTKEGQQKANSFGGSYYSTTSHDSLGSGAGAILILLFVALVFGVYKLFLCDNRPQHGFSYNDGHPGTYGQDHQSPPPPGFKSNFTGDTGGAYSSSNSGPGFWTGLGAGGLLGYLAGTQRSPSHHPHSPYYNTWTGPAAPPSTFGASNSSTTPSSSGTKSTSGFGGTKRR
ncbi:store-operated calcium entry-associated regulatory factor [Rhineura floridana]|uniref:store-operated calcium entry-associated regulatory factor n=1 Tax=Rhineura floridana TaxID=261503 RepID=UPI002AC7F968|nr:store-operated calcium entry-associated regulatory factor [Rhineura floridana]XP_061491200.1 store-operated calcium entry-associated regulatory factor [Rhineura floridana]